MNSEVFKSLINNAAFLMAVCVFYEIIVPFRGSTHKMRRIIAGILIGITGMLVMLNPWRFNEGVIFDTRSVLLCISGLFFGFVPTAIASLMTAALRLFQGGEAAIVGCCVIFSSSLIGLVWAKLRRRFFGQLPCGWIELYIFGIIVHLNMLAWMLLLSSSAAVLSKITAPVMLIYPILTVIIGKLLSRQNEVIKNRQLIKNNERRFRSLIENLPDIIVRYDRDLHIINANPAAFKHCKAIPADICGFTNHEAGFLSEHAEVLNERLRMAFSSGKTQRFELLSEENPENSLLIDMLLVPEFTHTENKPGSVIVFGRDISREREIEKRLRDNEKMDSVGKLAAGVAHDLNNRLTPALGYAELLYSMFSKESKHALYAQEVINSVRSSMKLVESLLSLGAKQTLSCRKQDLVKIVKDYVNGLQRQRILDLIFDLQIPEEELFCNVDQKQIQEMLYQLFLNVCDFSGARSTVSVILEKADDLHVSELAKDDAVDWLILKVADQGPGITEQTMKHVFEPFFTTKENGEGLGLPLARGIAVAHGGHLRLFSTPHKGTEVKIYLPTA